MGCCVRGTVGAILHPRRLGTGARSSISGEAYVSLATNCSPRCYPVGGSDILLTINKTAPNGNYEALLASGSCEAPTNQCVVALFVGMDGARVHTGVPVMTLTSGKYVLIVRLRAARAQSSGCGIIKHT